MRIVFMGTPDFAVASLQAICQAGHEVVGVVTVPDRPTGRGLKMTASPVKQYALEHSLPLLQPEKLRDPDFQESLRQWNADIFVVVAFRMLPKSVWAMPPKGTFNLNASLLPRYRGAAPINWAIINGETETGITTFMLNEHIDEGSILMQASTPITAEDDAGSVHDRLATMGGKLVIETLEGIAAGTLVAKPQPEVADAPAAPKIFKPDCAIDWRLPGARIVDLVRGLSPYPAATMQLQDPSGIVHPFKIYQVCFMPDQNSEQESVVTDGKSVVKIGVCDGFISILSLQISGKKRMTVAEFLRGCNLTGWKLML
jgi:methionyl-tRNA formyltransferase